MQTTRVNCKEIPVDCEIFIFEERFLDAQAIFLLDSFFIRKLVISSFSHGAVVL